MKTSRLLICLLSCFSLTLASCRPVVEPVGNLVDPTQQQTLDPDALKNRIDAVLDYTYEKRHLSTQDHAAWQILHGALTYQRDFQVKHEGKLVSAVDHILEGGPMKGWTVERGNQYTDEHSGEERFGLRAIMEPGTKAGQGHHDQWLAVLSQCQLPPETEIKVGSDVYTVADFVNQVQLDSSRNTDQEFSWTLIGLTGYLPTDATWNDSFGEPWSIEKLVQAEVDHGFNTGACGGTHRLIGISMALNRHEAADGKVEGTWSSARELIEQGIDTARSYQNPNGSFSTNYFLRPGSSPDLAEDLSTTGHTLEFLALSRTEAELKEPWMMRAADHMCEVFEKTEGIPLECGALYHAAHGLALYRERMFGSREYGDKPAE
ncbi:MAG: ADP-ribosylation factor-directed GTPase activating protein isoform b [Pirellulales bacterium]